MNRRKTIGPKNDPCRTPITTRLDYEITPKDKLQIPVENFKNAIYIHYIIPLLKIPQIVHLPLQPSRYHDGFFFSAIPSLFFSLSARTNRLNSHVRPSVSPRNRKVTSRNTLATPATTVKTCARNKERAFRRSLREVRYSNAARRPCNS